MKCRYCNANVKRFGNQGFLEWHSWFTTTPRPSACPGSWMPTIKPVRPMRWRKEETK